MNKEIKIKQDESLGSFEIAELSDDELEAVVGGAGQTGAMMCTCDECGAVLDGEDAAMNHYYATGHCSYHLV